MDDQVRQNEIYLESATGAEVPVRIAGIGGRSYAFIIDWHIRLLLSVAWVVGVIAVSTGSLTFEGFDADTAPIIFYVGLIPGLAMYFLYHPTLELLTHRTPGKRMAGIRIVSKQGGTPSAGAILIRNIFRVIDSLPGNYIVGLLVAFFDAQSARLGDIAAGTLLVYDSETKAKDIASLVDEGDGKLTAAQRELVVELLDRWEQLDVEARSRLAGNLLEGVGVERPQEHSPKQLDLKSKAALQGLLQA